MADFFAHHPLVGLLVITGLTALILQPYLRRQPDLLPLVGVAAVALQRWHWWWRGTPLFSFEVPLIIAAILSLSRFTVLFFVPAARLNEPASWGKKTFLLFATLIGLGFAFQISEHDIFDPAVDAVIASFLVVNVSLFALITRQEATVWAYAYNVIALLLTGLGILSPLEASFFYFAAFVPALILRAMR